MKTCKVYSLKVEEVNVPELTDYCQMEYFHSTPRVMNLPDIDRVSYEGFIDKEVVRVPIQEFSTYKLPDYLRSSLVHHEERIESTEYIVLDEHLEELLAGKYLNQIRDIQEDLNKSVNKFMKLHQEFDTFKGMSLWKRVKFLFKGEQ